ncbi:AfsR/SARP family transcriptional regulator [Streptomyces morookaense]|uniref:AfsR/SARP family transcriptional regulator n=1 Tax=Streptomyces morookaense TaxID=1970 RepID=UPI001E3D0DDC|nr:BTAD domain-containing putative transcriptional regulator [Streptomyces morookaense]
MALGPPKQRAVLGLLASHANDVVCVEHIIDAVWGSDVPQSAVNGVHTYVAGLRRALDPGCPRGKSSGVLVSASGGYCLCVDPESVDAMLFAQRHAHARRARAEGDTDAALALYADALSLWHGAAHSGVPGPFAAMERTRLQDLRLTAVEEWAADMIAAGRHAEAVTDLSGAAAEEPLRERLCRLLMLALYRCGRQAHALAVYADTRRLLSRELGIEPGAELRSLHRQILAGHPVPVEGGRAPATVQGPAAGPVVPDLARPAQLPPLTRGFVGRARQLAQCEKLLAEEPAERSTATPVAVFEGPAGVGKSAFALQLAHRLLDRFPAGQLYVDLRATSHRGRPLNAADALAQLLDSLGVDATRMPAGLAGRVALYRSLLFGRRMLVVLDDAADAEQVRPLVPPALSCVLVTSRQRLSGLAVRDGAHLVRMEPLDESASAELLGRLSGDRLRGHDAVALRLARMCGGLPLALRIAAEQLLASPEVAPAALAEQYAAERHRLDRLMVEDDAAADLRSLFETSYRRLPADAARMFRRLGLLRSGPVTVQEAAALADTGRAAARRLLDLLTDNHLLYRTRRQQYRFHDLVGIFAAECAEREPLPDREAALTRLARLGQASSGQAPASPAEVLGAACGSLLALCPAPGTAPGAGPVTRPVAASAADVRGTGRRRPTG